MFTGNTIDLKTSALGLPMHVERDCQLSYVGKVPSKLSRRFVPCGKKEHIEKAASYKDVVGIVTTEQLAKYVPGSLGLAISQDPVSASLFLHEHICSIDGFMWESFDTRIHSSSKIHPKATISEKDVEIGPNSSIGPGSVIQERSIIKADCHIGVDVVVGLDAFEIFENANPRRILKQAGGVILDSGATVLAKCTLVRATFGGFTYIGQNAMIDVLVHVAHDVVLEKNTTLVACSEISGRCELKQGAYIGPNACLRNGISIGKNAKVSMGAVVTRDVPDGETVSGNFAVPHADWVNFVKSVERK